MKKKPVISGISIDYITPWFDVVNKTVEGMPGTCAAENYYFVKPGDYVSVLALTENKQIVLVRQYRPSMEDFTIELPSGHTEEGESPEDSAKRELLEETGYLPICLEFLGSIVPDTGRMLNRMWCYFALVPGKAPLQDVREKGIETMLCDVKELKDLISKTEFNHALNLAVVTLAISKGKLAF